LTERGLIDTSVFIAMETGRALDEARLPAQTAISVITLAELNAGVLAATDTETAARRMATLNDVADMKVFGIDESTALMWARMRSHLAEQRRRVNVNDLWIAASAASVGIPVVTQDDDFDPLDGIAGLQVIRV
jgi:predicted nucleic acid-binding protein